MNTFDRQVSQAQRRLWLNRWLRQWGWTLVAAIGAWLVAWLVDRLFALKLPMGTITLAALGATLTASIVWLLVSRETRRAAAAALDEAAGLKERVSTGLHLAAFQSSDNPFERAVISDAERVTAGLTARRFIPIRWPGSLSLSSMLCVIALLSLLLPEFDVLKKDDARAAAEARQIARQRVQVAVAKPVEAIQAVLDEHPELKTPQEFKDLKDSLNRDGDPDALRREAVKQLDRLKDALKTQAQDERFKALEDLKKRLREVAADTDPKTEAGRLLEAMADGDFESAQMALQKMQEQLAKRARDGKADPEQIAKMKEQLDELSKKLQEAASQEQSVQEMKNAGMSQQDVQRVLDALSKKDTKQLEKLAEELAQRLKDKGVTQEQLKAMMEKLQKRQEAAEKCQKMGQCMNQASKQLEQGELDAAAEQMGEAGETLNEMEMMEQALNDLESQLSQLDQAKEELGEQENDGACKQCNGTGFRKDGAPCPHCNGTGNGMGAGRGFGFRDRDDNVEVDFENKKSKVKTTRQGRFIGEQFVKGRALKGASEVELSDAAAAAELDATDAINRDRVPAIYRKGVKNYFDRLREDFKPAPKPDATPTTPNDTLEPRGDGPPKP